jgi:flagellar FliJ protein
VTSPATLQRLTQLAQHRRDSGARRLAALVGERAQADAKLELLLQYRRGYQERLDQAARQGIDGDGLRNFRSFLVQLDRAIGEQADLAAAIARRLDDAHQAWRADQRKLDSYRTLDERRAEARARGEARRGQKQQDEVAARMRRRSFGGDD